MKKVFLFVTLFSIIEFSYSQQLEWYNTLTTNGQVNSYILPEGKVYYLKDNFVLTSKTCSRDVRLEGSSVNIISGISNNPDPYFISFDGEGKILNSQIIQTPNGTDNIRNICYNQSNGFVYVGLQTTSDSIRFENTSTWNKVKRKNTNTYNSFIVIYDYTFKFVTSFNFTSFNGVNIGDIKIDKGGNIYCFGSFNDSLLFNNKVILTARTKSKANFLLKLNSSNAIEWVTDLGLFSTSDIYFNEARNSIYLPLNGELSNTIIYSNRDSLNFPTSPVLRTIISEFDAFDGKLKQFSPILNLNGNGFSPIQIKGSNNFLLVNGYFSGTGLTKVVLDTDTLKYSLSQSNSNNFIIGFNASNLKYKFINFYDSCPIPGKLSLTDIYNDSLYSITGTTKGNMNFGFGKENIPAQNFLNYKQINLSSDYFATFTTKNNLKEVWYLSSDSKSPYSSFQNTSSIFEKNGNIYITANIQYHSAIGLGKRIFNYATSSNRTLTLLKYNCLPTAFFKYQIVGNSVSFNNLSSGQSNYLWQFGVGNNTSNDKDTKYDYPTFGGNYKPRLIVSNSCGKDTFQTDISITKSSTNFLKESFIKIFPNPTSSVLNIEVGTQDNSDVAKFIIYDILGKEVLCPIIQSDIKSYSIDAKNLSNGIFVLSIGYQNITFIQRFIISK